jgi:transcriptional repressor NrdR
VHCPACHATDTKVVDSRMAEEGSAVRRRRLCLACQHRFTTYERIEEVPLYVVKRSGDREAFDRSKIVAGVRASAKGRPVDADRLEALAVEVEDTLRLHGPEVTTELIGLTVLDELRRLDEVAYLRFASVYKGFSDVNDFQREVTELSKGTAPKHH